MIVVDTNVVAYFFIDGEKTERARALWDDDRDWRLPALWRHEYLNVLSTWARAAGVAREDVHRLWHSAEDLLSATTLAVDMDAALDLAIEHGISTYDAQFVTLAASLGTGLVTEDRKLIERFPNLVTPL